MSKQINLGIAIETRHLRKINLIKEKIFYNVGCALDDVSALDEVAAGKIIGKEAENLVRVIEDRCSRYCTKIVAGDVLRISNDR
jgi:hypothetical protein